jgi:hypothetical protein
MRPSLVSEEYSKNRKFLRNLSKHEKKLQHMKRLSFSSICDSPSKKSLSSEK